MERRDFMILFEPLHPRLCRFVHSIVWNREDARDIISETILIAFENFEKIRTKDAFLYYLFGVASRLSKNRERKKKLFGIFNTGLAENIPDVNIGESTVMLWELNAALSRLPLRQRETITLFEISGFSIKEIAQIQSGTESGVKSRLMRARETLSRLLEKEDIKTKQEILIKRP